MFCLDVNGVTASPHIDSRLKTLGAKFRAISRTLITSGFVWDDERKMVSVERVVYDEYCKNIYGKDYATGKPSKGYVEAINHLEKVAPSQKKLQKKRRKRDGAGSSNELASLQTFMKDMNVHLSTMANVMASTNEREKDTYEIEKKLLQQSEQVLEELISLNLEGTTPKQVFEVAEDLASKPHKLMIFSKCPNALKSSYVKSLIRENDDA
uniref:Myb/SANT-like domain-containing protein n=1 Tax=Chenopodium quinoa TaxID=63459 RepID=A0A803MD55_CHEQI